MRHTTQLKALNRRYYPHAGGTGVQMWQELSLVGISRAWMHDDKEFGHDYFSLVREEYQPIHWALGINYGRLEYSSCI